MCDHGSDGNTGEDFPDGCPFAVTRSGGLQVCACESKNSYGYDHFFHIFVLSELELGYVTDTFWVYSVFDIR